MASPSPCCCPASGSTRAPTTSSRSSRCSSAASTASTGCCSASSSTPLGSKEAEMSAFAGKVVWMTGAGTGIGKAGALMFAREGAAVALIGRRRDTLDEVAAEIQAFVGTPAVEALDVADRSKVGAAAQRLLKRLTRIDILVNNAGINVVNRRLDEITAADWDYILAVNLTGAFNMVQAALPPMREQRDGLIINV